MAFFDRVSTDEKNSAEINELQKALMAGYGTDSSQYTGGRTLIPENLETEVVNAVSQLKEDCKVMNAIKKNPVKSTVHEVNLRTGHGEHRFITVSEGGISIDTDQNLDRKTFNMKYLQTRRSVTKQMEAAETFEGALASEKLAGIETILKGAEHLCFHGDSAVVPTEFDGFESQIRKAAPADQNIISLAGSTIGSKGEALFDEIAQMVWDKGGDIDKALFPSILAKEVKELFESRQRYVMNQNLQNLSFGALPPYGTAVGSNIGLSGDNAGADKFYHVKGVVKAAGNAEKRPAAPSSVTASAAAATGSKFVTADAGNYNYTVHAVNQYGISAGTALGSPIAVAAGDGVTLTITPGSGNAATGFIICRSAKGGSTVMEMVSVPNSGDSTTVFIDKNEDLPGTASMLFLTERKIQPIYTFGQLLPACTFPLAPVASAETPFLVMLFGGLELRVPKFCGLVKDISYTGGLY